MNGGFSLAKHETTYEQWVNVFNWFTNQDFVFNNTYCEGVYCSL
jgi:hypothetical protein